MCWKPSCSISSQEWEGQRRKRTECWEMEWCTYKLVLENNLWYIRDYIAYCSTQNIAHSSVYTIGIHELSFCLLFVLSLFFPETVSAFVWFIHLLLSELHLLHETVLLFIWLHMVNNTKWREGFGVFFVWDCGFFWSAFQMISFLGIAFLK